MLLQTAFLRGPACRFVGMVKAILGRALRTLCLLRLIVLLLINRSNDTLNQGCSKSHGMCSKHHIGCINHSFIRMGFCILGGMYGYYGWCASCDSIPMVKIIDPTFCDG